MRFVFAITSSICKCVSCQLLNGATLNSTINGNIQPSRLLDVRALRYVKSEKKNDENEEIECDNALLMSECTRKEIWLRKRELYPFAWLAIVGEVELVADMCTNTMKADHFLKSYIIIIYKCWEVNVRKKNVPSCRFVVFFFYFRSLSMYCVGHIVRSHLVWLKDGMRPQLVWNWTSQNYLPMCTSTQ